MKEGGAYYWYQNDHLGTPHKLTDSSGAVVWSAQYTAFGQAQIDIETVTNHLRFPGQYFDAETGLYYNFQRYYDAEVGRYVSVDPIGFDGGESNFYTYGGNHPIQMFDSMGLSSSIGPGYPRPGWPQYPPSSVEERLEALPGIARTKGWHQLALFFERWFHTPGRFTRDDNPPDTSTITMEWVLTFDWAEEVYDRILTERVYANDASRDRILTKPWVVGLTEDRSTFGTPPPPLGADPSRMREFDEKHQLNFLTAEGNRWAPDALYAALANFAFHIIITQGEKFGDPLRDACLRIDQIGIYVKDSFDFIDDSTWYLPWTWPSQPLVHVLVNSFPILMYCHDSKCASIISLYF